MKKAKKKEKSFHKTPSYLWLIVLSLISTPFTLLWLRFRSPERYRLLMMWRYLHKAYRKQHYAKAEQLAEEYLALADTYRDDNPASYGNAIHTSHQILGLIQLHKGHIDQAKQHLLLAGQTPGSPNLDSYGPQMTLACELLKKEQRGVVLQYLESVAKFWASGTDAEFRHADRRNRALIQQWKAEIRAGGIPNHRLWK